MTYATTSRVLVTSKEDVSNMVISFSGEQIRMNLSESPCRVGVGETQATHEYGIRSFQGNFLTSHSSYVYISKVYGSTRLELYLSIAIGTNLTKSLFCYSERSTKVFAAMQQSFGQF